MKCTKKVVGFSYIIKDVPKSAQIWKLLTPFWGQIKQQTIGRLVDETLTQLLGSGYRESSENWMCYELWKIKLLAMPDSKRLIFLLVYDLKSGLKALNWILNAVSRPWMGFLSFDYKYKERNFSFAFLGCKVMDETRWSLNSDIHSNSFIQRQEVLFRSVTISYFNTARMEISRYQGSTIIRLSYLRFWQSSVPCEKSSIFSIPWDLQFKAT